MKSYLERAISKSEFGQYHVDVEYNRNGGKVKTIINNKMEEVTINCDVIVHSRGKNIVKDNLIAVEMKKSTQPQVEKDEDKTRLIALTKDSYDDIWSADGTALPEHVCGYEVGFYYEINLRRKTAYIEEYYKGILSDHYILNFQ